MKASSHINNRNSYKALKFDRTVKVKEKFEQILQDLFEPEYEPEPIFLNSTFYYVAC